MQIIYLLSTILLITNFVIVRKTEKKLNFLSIMVLTIILFFCYNVFVSYVLTFFTIPIKLWLLAIINFVIATILTIKIIKNKEIQKFEFSKADLIAVIVFMITTLVVGYCNFKVPFNVNYETSDPSVHFLTSLMYAENESLLAGIDNDSKDPVYGKLATRKTGSYVNSGLLMKTFCPNLDIMECYNIFVVFGMLVFFVTGLAIYSIMKKLAKKKEHAIWAIILALLCNLGYPLNSFLFGFEYLSMGLLIFVGIIKMVQYYNEKIFNTKLFITMLAFLNFGLFASYFMLVPYIYSALWIFFCIKNYKEKKKIITKELIGILSFTLLVPFALGFLYYMIPDAYAVLINKKIEPSKTVTASKYINGLQTDGYIYVNLVSNFVLLVPLSIYLLLKRRKEDLFSFILLLLNILFIFVLIVGILNDKVSVYYMEKNYFPLWITMFYINYKALVCIPDNKAWISRSLIIVYTSLMIVYSAFVYTNVRERDNEQIYKVMDIFAANKSILFDRPVELNQEEIEITLYAKNNLDYSKHIEVLTDDMKFYWVYVLMRHIDPGSEGLNRGQVGLNIQLRNLKKNIQKADYLIYFTNRYYSNIKLYDKYKDTIFEGAEVVYQNSAGGILKYNRTEN